MLYKPTTPLTQIEPKKTQKSKSRPFKEGERSSMVVCLSNRERSRMGFTNRFKREIGVGGFTRERRGVVGLCGWRRAKKKKVGYWYFLEEEKERGKNK